MNKSEAYHQKMVKTNVSKLILILGIPTTITMLISNIYNLVDTYYVGTLGVSQQGSIGILFTLQAIIQAFAFMLGHGSGTYAAKKLANKDIKEASIYVSTAFYVGFAIGLLLLIFGLIFIEPLVILLGSSDTILPYAKQYGMWVLISAPFMITCLVLNNILRYEGKAFFGMIGVVSGALLNIFGDFLFVDVMELGVFGAGMSTGISQIISFVILLFFYIRTAQTSLHFKYISRTKTTYINIFRGGLPSLLRQGLTSISGGVLNNLTKPFGDSAVAAISVVNRYSNFLMCIGMGIGQGLQPVAAFNYEIKQYRRVRNGTIFTALFSTAVVSILALITLMIPENIVRLFNEDSDVVRLGTLALKISAVSLIFVPLSVICNMVFQSIRKSEIASLLSTLRSGLIFIPLLYILVYGFNLEFLGIALSQPLSDLITFSISLPFIIGFVLKLNKKIKEEENNEKDTIWLFNCNMLKLMYYMIRVV